MLIKRKRLKNLKNHEEAKKLDKYRCVLCGTGYNIHIHHIRSRGAGGGDEIENLITLCFNCHRKVHDIGKLFLYGKLKYNPGRFIKFIEEYKEMHDMQDEKL